MATTKVSIFKYNKKLKGKLESMSLTYPVTSRFSPDAKPSKVLRSVYEALRSYVIAEKTMRNEPTITCRPYRHAFVGKIDNYIVAELGNYETSDLQLIMITEEGNISACIYNPETELIIDNYTFGPGKRDGTLLLLALMPLILEEEEAGMACEEIKDVISLSVDDDAWLSFDIMNNFGEKIALISDNVYRRIQYPTSFAEGIKVNIPATGNLFKLHMSDLSAIVTETIVGKPKVFKLSDIKKLKKTEDELTSAAIFDNFYCLDDKRIWNEEEQKLLPHIQPWYVIPSWVHNICKKIQKSSVFSTPIRNILLDGPSGTGKTEGSKAIFAGLGIPYTKTTCSVDSEIFDFIGQVFPTTDSDSLNYEEYLKSKGLPNVDDILFDLEGSYKTLTGQEVVPPTVDTSECIRILMSKVMLSLSDMFKNSKDIRYVESELIKAVRNGYGHEIQEPRVIKRTGVMVGLNSIFENGDNAFITLPTGETIKKHRNCCIILTTNTDYEGCAILNQSVLSRMDVSLTIDNPKKEEIMSRIYEKTGFEDSVNLEKMTTVIISINEHCRENDITDGVCGMRELENWVKAVMLESDEDGYTDETIFNEGLVTVLSKASQTKEDEEELISTCLTLQYPDTRSS